MENNSIAKKSITSYWLVILFIIASFFIVFITEGAFVLFGAPTNSPSFENVANKWESRIVRVESNGSSTGFIAESKNEEGENYLYIITSAHGIQGQSTQFVIKGKTYDGENLSISSSIDVAVFKVKAEGNYSLPQTSSAYLAEEVMALGYPNRQDLTAEMGNVKKQAYVDENPDYLPLLCYAVSSYVDSGMSGCPILTIDGELLGIGVRTKRQTVSNEEDVIFTSENYVVPASIIFAEYDRVVNSSYLKRSSYSVEMQNGAIVLSVDNKQVVYKDGEVKMDGKKVLKVDGKAISNIIDFATQISLVQNRYYETQVKVQLEDEEIFIKVVNE